jgi:hypothetical protein
VRFASKAGVEQSPPLEGQMLARPAEPAFGEEPSRTRENFMLKKLVVTSIVAAFAFLTPALAQTPDANAPAAEADQGAAAPKPVKAAHKKHKKHAAKKAKAKTDSADTEKKDGDAK